MTTPRTNEALENLEDSSEAAPPLNIFQFSALASLSSDRREIIETFHRQFLAGTGEILTDLLRLEATMQLGSVEVQTYGEAVSRRGDDNQGILFRMHPQPGTCLLDIPIPLALLLVERMMGGVTVSLAKETPDLSGVEQSILQQFAETFIEAYTRAWLPQLELRPEIIKQERHLNQRRLSEAGDMRLHVEIKVMIQALETALHLFLPIAAIEDLLMRRTAPTGKIIEENPQKDVKDKKSSLGSVPIPVSLRWQGFQISLQEVNDMAVGDLLLLDNKKCQEVAIWLGDMAKFSGHLSREPKKMTVTVTGALT